MKNQSWVWNGLKVSFLIIGTTIGAGFASGREIWEFFSSYGNGSSLFVIISMVLFSLSCYVIMSLSHRLEAPHYVQVLEELVGKPLAKIYDLLIFFYLVSTTVVMFAGSGATLQYWSFSYWTGVILISLLVFLVFLRDVEVMMSLNSILIPVMIMTLIFVCTMFIWGGYGERTEIVVEKQIFASSIAFTALNILPLIAVLSALGSRMKKREIKVASLGSAVGLCSVAFVYNESLLQVGGEIMLYEVPLFAILRYFSDEFMVGVSFILWLAIFTTAISGMFGLVTRFQGLHWPQWGLVLCFIICMIPLTTFGFATLIKFLYPLYGVLNLFVLGMILLYPLANLRKMG